MIDRKFIKFISTKQIISFFTKLILPIKPITDNKKLNLIREKLKNLNVIPNSIGYLKYKGSAKNLIDAVVLGDISKDCASDVIVSENILFKATDLELETHLSLAVAMASLTIKNKFDFILPFLIFIFFDLTVNSTIYYMAPNAYLTGLGSVLGIFSLASFFVSIFLIEQLKLISVLYLYTHKNKNIFENYLLLRERYLEKYNWPAQRSLMAWFNYLSSTQMQKLKAFLESKKEFNFSYTLKVYFKNPVILINVIIMTAMLIISLFIDKK